MSKERSRSADTSTSTPPGEQHPTTTATGSPSAAAKRAMLGLNPMSPQDLGERSYRSPSQEPAQGPGPHGDPPPLGPPTPDTAAAELLHTRSMIPHVHPVALASVMQSLLDDYPFLTTVIRTRCEHAMNLLMGGQQQHTSPNHAGGRRGSHMADRSGAPSDNSTPVKRGGPGGVKVGRTTSSRPDDEYELCAVHGNMRAMKHLAFNSQGGRYECVPGFHCLNSSGTPPASGHATPKHERPRGGHRSGPPTPPPNQHNSSNDGISGRSDFFSRAQQQQHQQQPSESNWDMEPSSNDYHLHQQSHHHQQFYGRHHHQQHNQYSQHHNAYGGGGYQGGGGGGSSNMQQQYMNLMMRQQQQQQHQVPQHQGWDHPSNIPSSSQSPSQHQQQYITNTAGSQRASMFGSSSVSPLPGSPSAQQQTKDNHNTDIERQDSSDNGTVEHIAALLNSLRDQDDA